MIAGPTEPTQPASYTADERRFVEALLSLRPHLAQVAFDAAHEQMFRDLYRDSAFDALAQVGIVIDDGVAPEDLELFLFSTRPSTFDQVVAPHLPTIAQFGDSAIPMLAAFLAWQREESYELFKAEYQVKALSRHTQGRWDNFVDEWACVTFDARRAVMDQYISDFDPDGMGYDWQVSFAATGWTREVEVPWVSSDRAPGSDDERAKPTGADGKTVSV